ncbi:hypothetical protein Ppa06_10930 [Planomonospora parontospora subsp. parontospora]|uniref:Uncharacterized protein n=1 Tax=Planomonospora parontospora subsp. parontospora TaxID=97194 RepID=A0ABQ4H5A4_9ACTN|nr:hypothetical protein Ppa06_10930 [Planomonospora parontospora subsp. parontospora]
MAMPATAVPIGLETDLSAGIARIETTSAKTDMTSPAIGSMRVITADANASHRARRPALSAGRSWTGVAMPTSLRRPSGRTYTLAAA